MQPLSACIITFNEEENIARCLNSLKGLVDDIVVVDSLSTDNTVKIAESMGARVFLRKFTGYGEQKYYAQEAAKNDWVFSIDADEEISIKLAKKIKEALIAPQHEAYTVNILTNYCGRWIFHCGWYPQPKIRLWNRMKASMLNDKVHEGIKLTDEKGTVGKLNADLNHYSVKTISQHLKKIEHYSEMGARFDVERGKKCSLFKLFIAPKWQFFWEYIVRLGFLDGYQGFVLCKNSSMASFVKYAKIRQMQQRK
jgi:glycosyltransferase involved in cell wall biosynthesis